MSGFRRIGHDEHDALLRSAVGVKEHEDPLHAVRPGQPTATKRKIIEVPYTETVQVPVHSKVHTKHVEERLVTGTELVPVQKYKDVKETVVEYKEEKVKGVKEVWVKKEVPYERIVRKPVHVVKTKRVPYTDYEQKEVQMKVKVPCDKLEVRTGYREDKVLKTRLMEVEQDLHLHHGPVVVREGTPRMREIGGGRTHGVTAKGKEVFTDGMRLRTGPDRMMQRSYSYGGGYEYERPSSSGSVRSVASGSVKQFDVRLNKPPGEAYGMKFNASDGESIVITKVKPGHFVSSHNERNPEAQLKRGDRIVEVNGVRGNAKQLMDACTRTSGPVKMTVQGRRSRGHQRPASAVGPRRPSSRSSSRLLEDRTLQAAMA